MDTWTVCKTCNAH